MSPSQAGVKVVGSGAPVADDTDEGGAHDRDDRAATRGERHRPSVLLVVLAVVALAGIVGTIVFWSKWHALSQQSSQAAAVTATSSDFLKALTNFDATTIDADFNRIESYAVGNFKTQANQFFSSDVRQALAKVQAVSRGQIRNLYVESLKRDQASVYGSVDQTIANINFKSPEQDQLRIVLNLTHTAQGWRISDVTVLQAPAVPTPGAATPGATGTTGSSPTPAPSPATTPTTTH